MQDAAGYHCGILLPCWGFLAFSVHLHLVAASTSLSSSWRTVLMIVMGNLSMVQQTDVHHMIVKMWLLDQHHRFVISLPTWTLKAKIYCTSFHAAIKSATRLKPLVSILLKLLSHFLLQWQLSIAFLTADLFYFPFIIYYHLGLLSLLLLNCVLSVLSLNSYWIGLDPVYGEASGKRV